METTSKKSELELMFSEIQYTLKEMVGVKIADHIGCTNFLLLIILLVLILK